MDNELILDSGGAIDCRRSNWAGCVRRLFDVYIILIYNIIGTAAEI